MARRKRKQTFKVVFRNKSFPASSLNHAIMNAIKCSTEHRGEWCDVFVNGIRKRQCFKGRCKKG